MSILIGHHAYGTDRVGIYDQHTSKEVGSIVRSGQRWDIYRGDECVGSERTMKAAKLSATRIPFNTFRSETSETEEDPMNPAQYREATKDMNRQQRTLKLMYPDTILLFSHDAESYRAYNEDARTCWATTDATVYADVFSHAAHDIQTLIETLVAAGHRVAMCDRVGTQKEDLPPMTPEPLDAAHYQYAPAHDAIVTADDIQSDRNSYNAEAYAELHDAECECDDCEDEREDALAMQPAYLPCKHCRTLTFAPQLRDGCCEACNYGDGYLTCECEDCVGIREWEAMGGRGVPVRPELQALAKHLETHPCRVFGINVSTINRALAGAAILALALSPHGRHARVPDHWFRNL